MLLSVVIGILPCDPGDCVGVAGASALPDNRVGMAATVVQVSIISPPNLLL